MTSRKTKIINNISLAAVEIAIGEFREIFSTDPTILIVAPWNEFFAYEIAARMPGLDERGYFKSRFSIKVDAGMKPGYWKLSNGENELVSEFE